MCRLCARSHCAPYHRRTVSLPSTHPGPTIHPPMPLLQTAFMKDAQKICPGVTEDMVEESFTGVMAQVSACPCNGMPSRAPSRVVSIRLLHSHVTSSLPLLLSLCVYAQVFEADGSAAKDYIFERKVRKRGGGFRAATSCTMAEQASSLRR